MPIMPLFHVHGLLASFLSPLYSGGTAIVPRSPKSNFWQVYERHKATWVSATPSMHRVILEFTPPSADALKRVRFIRSCSSQLSPAMFEKLEKTFGVPVTFTGVICHDLNLALDVLQPTAAEKAVRRLCRAGSENRSGYPG